MASSPTLAWRTAPRSIHADRRGDEGDSEAFDRDAGEVRAARQLLRSALRMKHPWTKSEGARIAAILENAAAEILRPKTDPKD